MEAAQLVEVRMKQRQLSVAATLAASRGTTAALMMLRAEDDVSRRAAEIAVAEAKADEILARHELECLSHLTEWIEEYMPALEKESNKMQRERAAEILPQLIQIVMVS
jgi:hypothetical protein